MVEILARVRALGREASLDVLAATKDLYAPYHAREPYTGVAVQRDVPYGPAPRQRLDTFTASPTGKRPVLLFVHGGGFVAGDKSRPDSPYHDNIALWAVRNDMVGVLATYRLAPDSQWPSGTDDIAAAVAWVRANAATLGADPDAIFVMGHSAGAVHVAGLVARTAPAGPEGMRGAILVGGPYDPLLADPAETAAYYGSDRERAAERSPVPGLLETHLPLLLAVAELDFPIIVRQAAALFAALCAHGDAPRFYQLAHHSHFSTTYHLGTDDNRFGAELVDFVQSTLHRA